MTQFSLRFTAVAAMLTVFSVGCGQTEGPELAAVTGTIKLDGQPLTAANIRFIPEKGSPSFGGTSENGRYKLLFNQHRAGAMLGKHRVEIEPREPKTDEQGKPLPGVQVVKLPKKYTKPGALIAEIKPGGNTVDFDLVSK